MEQKWSGLSWRLLPVRKILVDFSFQGYLRALCLGWNHFWFSMPCLIQHCLKNTRTNDSLDLIARILQSTPWHLRTERLLVEVRQDLMAWILDGQLYFWRNYLWIPLIFRFFCLSLCNHGAPQIALSEGLFASAVPNKNPEKSPGPSIFYESERDIRHCYDRFQRTRMEDRNASDRPQERVAYLSICKWWKHFWKTQIRKCDARIKVLIIESSKKRGETETAPQKVNLLYKSPKKFVAFKTSRPKMDGATSIFFGHTCGPMASFLDGDWRQTLFQSVLHLAASIFSVPGPTLHLRGQVLLSDSLQRLPRWTSETTPFFDPSDPWRWG